MAQPWISDNMSTMSAPEKTKLSNIEFNDNFTSDKFSIIAKNFTAHENAKMKNAEVENMTKSTQVQSYQISTDFLDVKNKATIDEINGNKATFNEINVTTLNISSALIHWFTPTIYTDVINQPEIIPTNMWKSIATFQPTARTFIINPFMNLNGTFCFRINQISNILVTKIKTEGFWVVDNQREDKFGEFDKPFHHFNHFFTSITLEIPENINYKECTVSLTGINPRYTLMSMNKQVNEPYKKILPMDLDIHP